MSLCIRGGFGGLAPAKSVRFTVGLVCRLGFWRNWRVWDWVPPVLSQGEGERPSPLEFSDFSTSAGEDPVNQGDSL